MRSFLELYKNVRNPGIQNYEIKQALSWITNLPILELKHKALEKEIKKLSIKKEILFSDLDYIDANIMDSQIHINKLNHEIQNLSVKINIKQIKLGLLEESLDDLISSEDFLKIKNHIMQTAISMLDDKNDLLVASVVTVIQAIKLDPNKGFLISGLYNHTDNSNNEFDNSDYQMTIKEVKDYLTTNNTTFIDLLHMVYDKILFEVQNQMLFPIESQEQFRNY